MLFLCFFLITIPCPVLGPGPSPGPCPGTGPKPKLVPVPLYFWSQPWSRSWSKFLVPSHIAGLGVKIIRSAVLCRVRIRVRVKVRVRFMDRVRLGGRGAYLLYNSFKLFEYYFTSRFLSQCS